MNGEQITPRNQTDEGMSQRKSRVGSSGVDGPGTDKKTQQMALTETAENNSKKRPVRTSDATPARGKTRLF
jgi:hypothetical protein